MTEEKIMAVVVLMDGAVEKHIVSDWGELWMKTAGKPLHALYGHKVTVEVSDAGNCESGEL